jgi:hypothetical protein
MRNRILGIALSFVAAGVLASQAKGQSVEGTFQLASEVHWSQAVLEPGEYHISIISGSSENVKLITIQSEQTEISFFGITQALEKADTLSCLKIVTTNGGSFVQELAAPDLDSRFVFPTPKIRRQGMSSGLHPEQKTFAVLISPVQKAR